MQIYTSNAAFDQSAFDVTYNGTNEAVGIFNSGSNTGLYISQSGDNRGLYTYSNVGASASSALAQFQANNVAFDMPVVQIENYGVGDSFRVNDQSADGSPFVIDASGNVGIGISAPSRLLDVAGAIRIAPATLPGSPAAGDLAIDSGAGNSLKYHNGTNWISLAVGGTGDFMASGTVAMTGALRHIAGNAAGPGMTFVGDTDNGIFAPAADNLAFGTSGTEKVRILANGNVGIGTTNAPNALSVVRDDGLSSGEHHLASASRSASGAGVTMGYRANGAAETAGFVRSTNALPLSLGTTGVQSVLFLNNDGSANFPAGNVGIGTTTTTRLLQVAGAIKINPTTNPGSPTAGDIFVDSSAANALKYHNGTNWVSIGSGSGDFMADGSVPMTGTLRHLAGTAAGPGLTFVGDTDNGMFLPAADTIALGTSGTERLRILPSGFLGIGNTSPQTALHVSRPGAANTAIFQSTDSGGGIRLDSATGAFESSLNFSKNGLARWRVSANARLDSGSNVGSDFNVQRFNDAGSSIDIPLSIARDNGYVGIGTTSPSRQLTVSGPIHINPAALPGTPAAGDLAFDNAAGNTLKYHNGSSWVALAASGSGDFKADGTVDMTGTIKAIAGNAAGPGMTFVGDTNTGIFNPAADNLAIATSGTEKMRILANGSVGLGTTNPGAALHIYTNLWNGIRLDTPSTTNLILAEFVAPGRTYQIGTAGSADVTYGSANKFFIRDSNANTNRFVIDSSGNTGIGTTTPTRLLHVAGALKLTPTTNPASPTAGDIYVDSAATNTLKYHNGTSWVSLAGGGTGDFLAAGTVPMTGNLRLGNNWLTNDGGNEGIFVTTDGKVGIGTSAPAGPFELKFNDATTLAEAAGFLNLTTSETQGADIGPAISFGGHDGSTERAYVNIGGFKENGTSGNYAGYFGISTRANGSLPAERLRISSAGNVGIGTTSPIHKLHVYNDTPSNDVMAYIQNASNSVGTNAVLLLQTTHSAADPYIRFQASGAENFYAGVDASDSGKFKIGSTSGAPAPGVEDSMTITSAGLVGIGTTDPTRLLQVAGAMKLTPTNNPASPTAGDIYVDSAAANVLKYHNGSAWVSLGSGGAGDFLADGTVAMTGAFRSIAGTAGGPGMTFVGDTNTGIFAPAADNVAIATSGTEKLRVLANGNIGIGTTAPGYLTDIRTATPSAPQLHISGTNADSGMYLLGVDANTAYWNAGVSYNGTNWISKSANNSIVEQANRQFAFYSDSGTTVGSSFTPTPRFVVQGGTGRVAINTNSTPFDLGFSGNNAITIGVDNHSTSTSNGSNLTLQAGASGLGTNRNGGDLVLASGPSTGNGGSGLKFQVVAGSQGTGTTVRSPTTAMTLFSTGSIAIGTTNANSHSDEQLFLDINSGGSGAIHIGDTSGGYLSGKAQSAVFGHNLTYDGYGNLKGVTNSAGYAGVEATSGALSFHTSSSTPNWTTITNPAKMTITSAGLVGIGTTGPTRLLQVAGAMKLTPTTNPGSPTAGDIYVDSSAANVLKYHNGSAWVSLGIGGAGDFLADGTVAMTGAFRSIAGTAGGPGMTFVGDTGNGIFAPATNTFAISTSGTERIRVLSGGNVGIGITTPLQKVHASGGAADVYFRASNSQNPIGVDFGVNLGAPGASIIARDNTFLAFGTNNNEKMRVLAGGNVGIGTSTPGRLLHVAGPMRLTSAALPGTPAAGDIAIDSADANKLKYHDGTSWQTVGTGGSSLVVAPSTESLIGGTTGASSVTTASLYNTVYGYQAMNALTSGNSNVAVGKHAATSLTSGAMNVVVGNNAGSGITTASSNVAIGANAFTSNTSGSSNIAIGTGALTSNTTNHDSTAVGQNALQNSTGGSNTAFGHTAGNSITTGTGNLALGRGVASSVLTTGSNNILIGTSNAVTTPAANTDNFLNIGNVIFATGITGTLASPAGNVGIGTTAPSRLLQVAGAMKLTPTTNPASPTAGDIYVDSAASNVLKYHNGTSWVSLAGGGGSGDFLAAGTVPMTGNLRMNGRWLSNDGGNEGVWVATDGKVGIGTSAPGSALEVNGNVEVDGLTIWENLFVTGSDFVDIKLADDSASSFVVYNNTTPILVIPAGIATGAGNVGIGSTAPVSKLEVAGRFTAGTTTNANALSSITANFSASNMIRASGAAAACGTLNFTNVVAGGSYTITIPNATATCTTIHMNGATTNVKLPSGYGAGGLAAAGVVYTAIHDGTTLWVSFVPF